MKKHQKFTVQERDLLALWLSRRVSKSACARRLHRPRHGFKTANEVYYQLLKKAQV